MNSNLKYSIVCTALILVLCACGEMPNKTAEKNSAVVGITTFSDDQLNQSANFEIKQNKCSPNELNVYLNDPDTNGTNIRKRPAGEVLLQLIRDDLNMEFAMVITETENGWFKLKSPIMGDEKDIELPSHEAWIHGSVIAVDTKNYSGQHLELLDSPENGKIVATIKTEIGGLGIKDMCNNWVQVEYEGILGWIESKWLCGNPYTNCS